VGEAVCFFSGYYDNKIFWLCYSRGWASKRTVYRRLQCTGEKLVLFRPLDILGNINLNSLPVYAKYKEPPLAVQGGMIVIKSRNSTAWISHFSQLGALSTTIIDMMLYLDMILGRCGGKV
jgi:hypothetical protein